MSWALLSINRHLTILKVKVHSRDFIKHYKIRSDHTALILKKIVMKAFICCCLPLENLFRTLLVSVHLSWYLATLCVDL